MIAPWSALADPLPGACSTGIDLRASAGDLTLERVRQARVGLRPEEDWLRGAGREPDWSAVLRECSCALQERSKDLELAIFLAEALAARDGLAGLASGLELVHALLDRFADALHPALASDPDGEARARLLGWLGSSRAFLETLRDAPLLDLGDGVWLTWLGWRRAEQLEQLRVEAPQRERELREAGVAERGELLARLGALASPTLDAAHVDCTRALASVRALEVLCAGRFSAESAPSFEPLASELEAIAAFLLERTPAAAPAERRQGSAHARAADDAAPPASVRGASEPRERAIALLREASAALLAADPHSPVAYLVRRAIRWSELPLPALLRELVRDPEAARQLRETLGVEAEG